MKMHEFQMLKNYIAPYKFRLIQISILALFSAFFEAVNIGALVPLLQLINMPGEPGGNLWFFLTGAFALVGLELNFTNLLLVMAMIFLIGQALLYIKKEIQVRLWFKFSADLKNKVFGSLLKADMPYHYSQKSGEFIDILTRETELAATSVFAVTEIMTYLFFIVVYSIMLLYISAEMTLICLVIALTTLYLLNRLILKSKELGKNAVDVSMGLNGFIGERLSLLKVIKIFSTEQKEQKKFKEITGSYQDANSSYMINGIKIESIFQVILFSIAIIILFISTIILNMPLPVLLVFIFILIRLTDPLRQLNARRHELAGELASLEKINHVLKESEAGGRIRSGSEQFHGFSDIIVVKNVSFAYNQNSPVLRNVSFAVKKNRMVALVGASGGGKSTIVDLLIRLLEPDTGRILVDGTDLRQFDLESYHSRIGFVSQESYIFNDSVQNNICYGSGFSSFEDVWDAARVANADDFIMGLPDGYGTMLGDRGVKLSGGQKQRISLARAVYKQPDILILDEATSALDSESEKIIQQSILNIKNRYTIIAIAHRLSTIVNADEIVVVEKGEIVEVGTHQDLLERDGVYAKYYRLQHGGMI